jgi:hypothetical protein
VEAGVEVEVEEVAAWAAWVVRGCSRRVEAIPAPSGFEESGCRAELTLACAAARSRAPGKAGWAGAVQCVQCRGWERRTTAHSVGQRRWARSVGSGRPMIEVLCLYL